jgi:hypothetical protein
MLRLLLVLAILSPTTVHAQFAAALGFRSVNGDESATANQDRRGYEFRAQYDGPIRGALGWRAELTAVQMQFLRDMPDGRRQISENGAEASALIQWQALDGALAGGYVVGGPTASFRLGCARSGGFVPCDSTPAERVGVTLGLGYRWPMTQRRDGFLEVRMSEGIAAGAGAPVWTLAFGLGLRRLSPNQMRD